MHRYCLGLRKWVKAERAKILFLVALPLAAAGCRSAIEAGAKSPDIRHAHPIPGTNIVRFEELDEGVYNGSRPKTDADYEFLRSKHINYIVDLRLFPWLYRMEKNRAAGYGMTVIPATINASPVTPSETHVNYVLCLLHDKRYRPIYFHCDLGRDRAMLIAGLYDMYYRGMSKEEAWKHMKHYGFKDDWTLHGLKKYFEMHSKSPVDKYIPDCTRVRNRSLPAPACQAETQPCGAN
jgi:rhodanese/phosphatase family protein